MGSMLSFPLVNVPRDSPSSPFPLDVPRGKAPAVSRIPAESCYYFQSLKLLQQRSAPPPKKGSGADVADGLPGDISAHRAKTRYNGI